MKTLVIGVIGADVHAVVNAYVQLQGNAAVVVEADVHALGHGLSPQKLQRAALLAAPGHAFYAEAAGSRIPRQIHEHLAGNADIAHVVGNVHHLLTAPFCKLLWQQKIKNIPASAQAAVKPRPYYNTKPGKAQGENEN